MRIIKDHGGNIWTIGLIKGATFRTNGRIPDQAIKDQLVYVGLIPNLNGPGKIRELTAGQNIILLVKGLHKKGHCCWDVLFVREDGNNDAGIDFVGPCDIPDKELTVANHLLRKNSISRCQSLDGFCGALIYPDEIAIPDTGSPTKMTGWILTKLDYEELLATGQITSSSATQPTNAKSVVTIDPVAEAEAELARASAKLEAVKKAAAIKDLVDDAAAKRTAAVVANKAVDTAKTKVEEAKQLLAESKAALRTAETDAAKAENVAAAAEEAAAAATKTEVTAVA